MKKGFTLIELLAVIVILAVIALIAVPLILSLVNKSRLKAAEESALFYVDTIENMLMINNIENTDGKTYFATVYLDPTDTTKICTKEEALANVNEYGTPTEIKTGCMRWYVYKEEEENYTMILDHNMGAIVTWNTTNGPANINSVSAYFNNNASDWEEDIKNTVRLIRADEIAEITGADREETLKWSPSKRYASSNINIENQISRFYLDGSGNSYSNTDGWMKPVATTPGSSRYAWLYNYTNGCTGGSTEYGCDVADNNTYTSAMANNPIEGKIDGYWTSQQAMGCGYSAAWMVYSRGQLTPCSYDSGLVGIRPVITVKKSIFFSE